MQELVPGLFGSISDQSVLASRSPSAIAPADDHVGATASKCLQMLLWLKIGSSSNTSR